MKEIKYTIKDELGIHARPAGRLVKQAAAFEGKVQIGTPAKMVDAKRVMGVMGLAIKQGVEIAVQFEGAGEEAAAASMLEFLEENL